MDILGAVRWEGEVQVGLQGIPLSMRRLTGDGNAPGKGSSTGERDENTVRRCGSSRELGARAGAQTGRVLCLVRPGFILGSRRNC